MPALPTPPSRSDPANFNSKAEAWAAAIGQLNAADWFNVLGTVSQSGGVPTGDLFERGDNANGEYVRFADGTQICWFAAEAIYTSATRLTYSWTFPAAFAVAPIVIPTMRERVLSNSVDGLGPDGNSMGTNSITASACSVKVYGAGFTAPDKVWLSLQATGRWFT